MTIREVAAACRLSESAVRRAIADGELPAVKLRSRLRIMRSDFDAWVSSRRRQVPVRSDLALNPSAGRKRRAATAGSFRALVQADAERTQAR